MMKNDEKNLMKIAFLAGVLKDFRWLENQLEKYQRLERAVFKQQKQGEGTK